jgi:hypothetical protein
VRPKRLYQRKIPMTPSGIEPATFGLVAQCLNQIDLCVDMYVCVYGPVYVENETKLVSKLFLVRFLVQEDSSHCPPHKSIEGD